ncbi:hypothetical protein LCGC14_0838830 [marine sediment metagenome]|uniref:Uncharacterized protein n=1 Tax=marine sediment metagenome TaxID=412755 RepID=A0A0F9PIF6_9ZZZZ
MTKTSTSRTRGKGGRDTEEEEKLGLMAFEEWSIITRLSEGWEGSLDDLYKEYLEYSNGQNIDSY